MLVPPHLCASPSPVSWITGLLAIGKIPTMTSAATSTRGYWISLAWLDSRRLIRCTMLGLPPSDSRASRTDGSLTRGNVARSISMRTNSMKRCSGPSSSTATVHPLSARTSCYERVGLVAPTTPPRRPGRAERAGRPTPVARRPRGTTLLQRRKRAPEGSSSLGSANPAVQL